MVASDSTSYLSRPGFLAAVRASGLVAGPQLDRAAAGLPAAARTGPDVAHALVGAGVLTGFQADRLLAGKTDGFLLGQYVVLDQLGKGPAGRVYKARHRAMNRLVAVKVLSPDLTRDPARRAAFQTDARAAARLAHPHVVTVLDTNQVRDRLYLVLEYVDGAGLDAVVGRGGPLPVRQACEFARQAALGLQHAHDKGVVHGRVGPAHLLVGRPGGAGRADRPAVKVSGFETGPCPADPAAGDPADYRAPETLAGAAPAPAADLYALGGTLYFLLTGHPPFPGGSARDKAQRHLSAVPPAVTLLRPDVPPAVAGLIQALLAKDPAGRPLTAADVAARLEPFAAADDPAACVEFAAPVPAGGATSAGGGVLTGLHAAGSGPVPRPAAPSPWAELEAGPTLDAANGLTPIALRPRPSEAARSPASRLLAVLAAVLLVGTAAALAAGIGLRLFR